MKTLFLIISISIFLFSACAPIPQAYEPIIDTGDSNFTWYQYQHDLRECRAYAERVSPANQAVGEALAGAAFGAALGAILGSGSGYSGRIAGIGAGSGGLMGIAHGGSNAVEQQKRVIRNCMAGRGYRILE